MNDVRGVYDLICSTANEGNRVPFCCVQVVPGSLEIDENRLEAGDIEITFTPQLRCCVNEEVVDCNVNGASCEIDAQVLRLIGCIEYALSTRNGSDPIYGEVGAEAVAAGCSSCVCVNRIICCAEDGLECPEDIDLLLEEISVKLNDAAVEKCPEEGNPDKKIIKFTGEFILPTCNNIR